MGTADELEKLHRLHASGALSDDEYTRAKDRLLSSPPPPSAPPPPNLPPPYIPPPAASSLQPNQWAMLLHLSQFAGCVLPFAGFVVPLVIWQLKKAEFPQLDIHGKIVMNWIISALIYGVVCIPLCFLLIGFPLLIALGVVAVVFPIIGCIKANDGQVWPYPMSIAFLK